MIKFRIWDETLRKMEYINLADLEDSIATLDSYCSVYGDAYFKTNPKYVMPCTDLCDSNKNLIYINDICCAWVGMRKAHLTGIIMSRENMVHMQVGPEGTFYAGMLRNIKILGNTFEGRINVPMRYEI